MDARLRALGVALHLAAVTIVAIPRPPAGIWTEGLNPQQDRALQVWAEALPGPADANRDRIRTVAAATATTLDTVKAVPRVYTDLVGAKQGWLMFGRVSRHVTALEVDARTADGWIPLFRPGDPDHAWARTVLDQERVRAVRFGLGNNQRRTNILAAWALHRVADERSEVEAVRVQVRRQSLRRPGGPTDRDRTGRVIRTATASR